MNTVMWIVTGACFLLLIAGFLIGFFRNWCRSLVRLSIVIISFALSFFLSPVLVKVFMDKLTVGNTFSIFSFDINFDNIAGDYIGEGLGSDLSLVSEEVSIVAKALITVALSVALFLISFIVLVLFSLIIYWIVLLIVVCVKRKNKEEAKEEAKKKKSIGLRFLGGFEGLLTMLIICFAILIPVFGAMNICNVFLEDAKKKANEQVASAYTPSANLICGQLYYTENESIGKIEGVIETYANIKESYDKSPVGFVFKYTGLRYAGSGMFNYLTRVDVAGQKVKFSNELVAVIKTYNVYKESFVETKFNIQDNASLDNLNKLIDTASESKIAEDLIVKLVPVASERIANGEKFFGLSLSVDGDYKVIVEDTVKIFQATKSISRIKYNVKTIVDTLKVVNEHNIIDSIEKDGLIGALEKDETIVKDVLSKLAVTEEIKNNLPIILNDLVEFLYNEIVEEKDFAIPENKEYNIQNWNDEITKIQGVVSGMLETYSNVLKDGNTSSDAMLNELQNIGKTIDNARASAILSDSVKEFMTGLLNSNNVNFGDKDQSIKESLISYINQKWDIKENPTFKFEDSFKVLADTAKIAINLNTSETANLKDMTSVLETIIADENLKDQTIEILQNDELISSIVGDSDSSVVVKDIVETFVQNTTTETLETDLEAGQAVIDLITINTDPEFNTEKAETLIETIATSENVMSIIETAVNDETKESLQNLIDENVSNTKKAQFNSVIQNSETLTAEQKALLASLFSK